MKLFSFKTAPNARKITIYLNEKGIILPFETVEVDLMVGEQNSQQFKKINPLGKVPVLQLEDGSSIWESLSIIEYFEEIYPEVPMIGENPEERAKIKSVERFIEMEIMAMMGTMAHHMMPLFSGRFKRSQEVIDYARARQAKAMDYLDDFIGDRSFVHGNKVSLADISLFVTFETAHFLKASIDTKYKNITRCFESFAKRESVTG